MKKRQTWKGAVLASGLVLATLLTPAIGQPADQVQRGDSQKPVLNTYDKAPDPSGDNQKLDAVQYQQPNKSNADVSTSEKADPQKPVVETYDKQPDPSGKNQKLDAVRYDEDSSATDGRDTSDVPAAPTRTRTGQVLRGDSQKTTLPTYNQEPAAQSITERPSQNDVSNMEEPSLGDQQKPVIPSYDKRPDPKGEAQKLDAVRYHQENEANDGRESELEVRVLEGSIED